MGRTLGPEVRRRISNSQSNTERLFLPGRALRKGMRRRSCSSQYRVALSTGSPHGSDVVLDAATNKSSESSRALEERGSDARCQHPVPLSLATDLSLHRRILKCFEGETLAPPIPALILSSALKLPPCPPHKSPRLPLGCPPSLAAFGRVWQLFGSLPAFRWRAWQPPLIPPWRV